MKKYFPINSRGQHFPDVKPEKRYYKKIKLVTNISHEHRCRSFKQNFSTSNPIIHKNQYMKWGFPQEYKVDLTI